MLCNHNDQTALKHSLNQGRSNEKHNFPSKFWVSVRSLSLGLIIVMAKKYALISPLWPRYSKSLLNYPRVYVWKNEQTTSVCKQRWRATFSGHGFEKSPWNPFLKHPDRKYTTGCVYMCVCVCVRGCVCVHLTDSIHRSVFGATVFSEAASRYMCVLCPSVMILIAV